MFSIIYIVLYVIYYKLVCAKAIHCTYTLLYINITQIEVQLYNADLQLVKCSKCKAIPVSASQKLLEKKLFNFVPFIDDKLTPST